MALVLSFKSGEEVVIHSERPPSEQIRVKVELIGTRIRLHFEAEPTIRIDRRIVYDRVHAQETNGYHT